MSNPYSSQPQQGVHSVPQNVATAVRGLQIIVFALVMGLMVFMGITLVITKGAMDGEPDILSWIGIGFAALMIMNHLVIPSVVTKSILAKITPEQVRTADDAGRFDFIFPAFRTKIIIAVAMLEGAAFLNLVMYMITKYMGNIGAAGFLMILIFGRATSTTAANFWVNDRIREIEMR